MPGAFDRDLQERMRDPRFRRSYRRARLRIAIIDHAVRAWMRVRATFR